MWGKCVARRAVGSVRRSRCGCATLRFAAGFLYESANDAARWRGHGLQIWPQCGPPLESLDSLDSTPKPLGLQVFDLLPPYPNGCGGLDTAHSI